MSKRAETGSMQFGDDWPGVFIRGDNAGPYGMYLASLLEDLEKNGEADKYGFNILMLSGLAKLLSGSHVAIAEPQMLKPFDDCEVDAKNDSTES